ncbi:10910_t:CDS:2 [Ambispora leptoticha]|uniref:10910_t:CDS:1 n=1 Tax=Ambispora leptoticha TaxID=144679 RepID=A0A9N9BJF7_9GLOM|nr:10910_t:CDS:2 [Ambispora leptoticha]
MSLIESALELEEIDVNYYRSRTLRIPLGGRGVFGGQIVGQALVAAIKTTPKEFNVHSLHSYFVLPGDNIIPILYEVERIRDGKSYCTRTVKAIQKGRCIFTLICSFTVTEPSGIEHQYPMPECLEELMREFVKQEKVPRWYAKYLEKKLELENSPIEIRNTEILEVNDLLYPKQSNNQKMWIKAKGKLGDDISFHKSAIAYASDFSLLYTAARPHGISPISKMRIGMLASLCHSIWFHDSNFRADEWLLYTMETPKAAGGRALASGRIYTQDGRLIVSVSQEGVLRLDKKKSKI